MVFTARLWRVTLGALLGLALSWLPASAAVDAYMKIDGIKQGPFKGEVKRNGSTQWIPVITVSQAVEERRDVATGQATGKRQHKLIKITKETGASSPQLARAAASGETLREVVIEFVRRGPKGQEEMYQTVTLTNAVLSSIERRRGGGAGKEIHDLEDVSFIFEKIEVKDSSGKISASDDWLKGK